MPTFAITYDLMHAGQNYEAIIKKIKSYGSWCHPQQSVWLVRSNKSAQQIRDDLLHVIDKNDRLFVARLTGEAAWYGLPLEVSNWIKEAA